MITIDEYVKPKNIADAYGLLTTRPNASIVGGGLFLRQGSRKIGLAVDLTEASLSYVRETGGDIEIGAMATFGDLAQSPLLKKYFDGVLPAAVSGIVGTQFRNMATVGGSVYSRLGFSELLTCLLALDCRAVFYSVGEIPLEDFLTQEIKKKDILEKILLKKTDTRASYQPFKNTFGGLPLLSVAASRTGKEYKIAAGARPGVAELAKKAMAFANGKPPGAETFAEAAGIAAEELAFSTDRRATREYRKELCRVLVKRALLEVQP